MALVELNLNESYWKTLEIKQSDIEFLYAFLLERETPLTSSALAEALILERIRLEKQFLGKKQQQNGEIYAPKMTYTVGDKIQFPALGWAAGEVVDIRDGVNPEYPDFQVITVQMENGQPRMFAANLETHVLNDVIAGPDGDGEADAQAVIDAFGTDITAVLEEKLDENKDIVRIGEYWFPKSLLIEFNVGHLNLAEAVLDMHEGGPLPVNILLEQIDVASDDPEELVHFSFNYALQEDPRFDEVGSSGEVQWFLNRLEPEYVREKPITLTFPTIEVDRTALTEDMLQAEQNMDDELVVANPEFGRKVSNKETSVILNYPHWRTGSLPLTPYTRPFFPTALESPRVKFTMVDQTGEKISAWVVRPYSYVYGLRDWYEEMELMPGSILNIRPGKEPGEVFIGPQKKRSNREWIKTLLIGADGGIVFAMLKQTITADFNERMAVAIPATDVLDELWKKRANNPRPLKNDIISIMRELAKLNPQGHVHSIELYAALNCIRRCPPGVIFSMLASNPEFTAVGDLYFHLNTQS